ncbi:DUF423 domain-containing protein [Methylolobus aquaticus]|nr:DUF423 domain-containing protein [Methylolobus aquaticus]
MGPGGVDDIWAWRVRLFAAISGFVGVAMGAFGAHGLRGQRAPELLAAFQTGVQYLFWHALALLLIAALWCRSPDSSLLRWSAAAMAAGIALFSGSLFVMVLTEQRWLGMVTPFGGVSFMLGWLLLARHCLRQSRTAP